MQHVTINGHMRFLLGVVVCAAWQRGCSWLSGLVGERYGDLSSTVCCHVRPTSLHSLTCPAS